MSLSAAARQHSVPGMPPLVRQVRWTILALLLSVTIINFVDRQSLSIVAPLLRESLRLSNTDYGIIVAAFQMGMMLAEFPMGWLMDRRGVKFGLTFAVAWWSVGNIMHAFGRSMLQFSLLRFWLGTGECGNYSGGIKLVSQWFPVRERALAVGVFNGGSMLGSIIAPPLLVVLTLNFGWHAAFLLPGAMGLVWVLLWRRVYRAPEDHPGISAAERAYIIEGRETASAAPPSNRELLGLRQTWALMLCRLLAGPVVQFYIYWLPEYLYRERGLSLKAIGLFAWVPFLFGDIGSIAGGWVAGRLIRAGFSVTSTRRITMIFGGACCLLSFAVAAAHTVTGALTGICAVLLGHTFFAANMFAAISDVFPNNAVGRVTALTGIAGGLSGMLFPLLTGVLVDRFSYLPVFSLAAVMPLAACAVLFLMVPSFTWSR
ncbi:MAG: MFS transporter [Acidobacteria bacterium]|nr:MFS transporter [Acidobacteriota bacterium]